MSALERLQPHANRIIDQFASGGLEGLTSRDQTFFLAWAYGAELDNGGHSSFFYNSEGAHYAETLDALQTLGLPQCAELLRRAATLMFQGEVPNDILERNAAMEGLDGGVVDEELASLDQEFGALGGGDEVLSVLAAWYLAD